jgi:hypothetical protein
MNKKAGAFTGSAWGDRRLTRSDEARMCRTHDGVKLILATRNPSATAQPGSICADLFPVIGHNRARCPAHRQLQCSRLSGGDLHRHHPVSFLLSRFTAFG